MKFSLARPVLALAVSALLASCGGGGKATFPINVSVTGLIYPNLVLSTNGMDLVVSPPADPSQTVTAVFPNQIEYGQTYDVIPKGQVLNADGSVQVAGGQPPHQTCAATPFPVTGTAGQLAKIDIRFTCSVNAFPLSGTISGLTADGLVLANGSNDSITVAANSTTFVMNSKVPYAATFGLSVLKQPTGLNCTVTGGNSQLNNGSGVMNDAAEAANGVSNLAVACVPQATTTP